MKTITRSIVVAVLLAGLAGVARADEESPTLAPYRTQVEQAIDKGLGFLADQMLTTGPDLYKDQYGNTNAIAGLVGMAFLAKGYLPDEASRYGQCINACADHILNSVDPKNTDSPTGYAGPRVPGYLGSDRNGENMYGHAIATLFLSEISGMVDPERQKMIDAILPKAMKLLLAAQKVEKPQEYKGGWRYMPTSPDSDISVTGWCVLALRSSRMNGAPVPDAAITDAIGFLDRIRDPRAGGFGYTNSGDGGTPSRTGVGILCRELTGHHDDEINRKAAESVLTPLKSTGWESIRLSGQEEYATYYCSQAMFQLGGAAWEEYAVQMYKALLSTQQDSGAWRTGTGQVYPTAMYVLALTVSCRQLPIYQR